MAKPKIFVSHSSLDTAFATKLVNDLNAAGADAWMDLNDLGAGNFQENISKALADCEWFVAVLTRDALASKWVPMEVDAAIRLKHQNRVKELIFIQSVALDPTALPALWGVFNIFDATADYGTALSRTLKAVGLTAQRASAPALPMGKPNEHTFPFVGTFLGISVPGRPDPDVACPHCGAPNRYDLLRAARELPVVCASCKKAFLMPPYPYHR